MKYFMILSSVAFIAAISGWACYGIFESKTMSFSEKCTLSALVWLFEFIMAFCIGVFINQRYPFK